MLSLLLLQRTAKLNRFNHACTGKFSFYPQFFFYFDLAVDSGSVLLPDRKKLLCRLIKCIFHIIVCLHMCVCVCSFLFFKCSLDLRLYGSNTCDTRRVYWIFIYFVGFFYVVFTYNYKLQCIFFFTVCALIILENKKKTPNWIISSFFFIRLSMFSRH